MLVQARRRHPDVASALQAWVQVVQDAAWQSLTDVRRTYPAADGVQVDSGRVVTVFNIRGNNYRLLTWISYRAQLVSVIDVLTHADYDKNRWKRRL